MFKYAKPTIPLGLLHDIEELEPGGSYDQANGGQWKPTKPTSKTFKGVVMPVNNEDRSTPSRAPTRRTAKSSTPTATASPSGSRYETPSTGRSIP